MICSPKWEKKTFIRKKGIDKINFPQNGQTGSGHKNPPHTEKFRVKEEGLTEVLGYVQSYQRSINYQLEKITALSAAWKPVELPSAISNTAHIFNIVQNPLGLCNIEHKGSGNNTIDF